MGMDSYTPPGYVAIPSPTRHAVTIQLPGTSPIRAAATSSWRRDLVTVLFGVWMVVGLFADGWAHLNDPGTTESFFTPWHALLYTGFLAAATWTTLPALGTPGSIRQRLGRLPIGYGLGFAGAVVFGLGAIADLAWHESFGIEVSIEALLSPTHLLLLTGGLLVLTTPVRARWHDEDGAPGLGSLLPAVLGTAVVTALVAFFLAYAWGLLDPSPTLPIAPAALDEAAVAHQAAEQVLGAGIVNRLLSVVVLLGPLLVLLRRWRLPAGSATIVFGVVAGLVAVLYADVAPALPTLATVAAGVVTDVMLVALRPGPDARVRTWTFAALVAVVVLGLNLAAWHATAGLTWPVELWTGTVVLGGMTGFGLGLLSAPPTVSNNLSSASGQRR